MVSATTRQTEKKKKKMFHRKSWITSHIHQCNEFETQDNNGDNDMGNGTDVPPIGLLSNIPESPMAQSHLATAEILKAEGYDSDKEVNNNNPIINEESLEEEEEELPEVGENLDAAEEEETATNVGTFVDIPQEAMKKMKVVELKAELTKRVKSTTGQKAVLLERLKDAIGNRVVIVGNTPGATTTTPDDLRGFAETAH